MASGHVEIAGAGLGGLSAAAAFAKNGWSVTVHERAQQIRATGAGIYIAENGVKVLEALGADKEALREGYQFSYRETRDHRGRVVATYHWPKEANQRIYVLSRETLVHALLTIAKSNGVELCLNSHVAGADPEGILHLKDGRSRKADLVIGADGVNSIVRETMSFEGTRVSLRSGATRAIVPRLETDRDIPPDTFAEYWSGTRRVFYAPISKKEIYLALMTVSNDRKGSAEPPDIDSWVSTFPFIEHVLRRIDNPLRWAPFEEIKLKRWSKGRVALIGDAAHAMAPNMGQGGGTAMMDGVSLATNITQREGELTAALDCWEQRERPVVNQVQKVSSIYGGLSDWPTLPRNIALWLMGKSEWVMNQRMCAANFIPDGVEGARSL